MNSPLRGATLTGLGLPLMAGAWLLVSGMAMGATAPVAAKAQPAQLAPATATTPAYAVHSIPSEPLNKDKPKLPDLTGYTAQAVEAKVLPLRGHPADVRVRRMLEEDVLKAFVGGDNRLTEWVRRQHDIPQAIFIDKGYVNLADLTKSIPKEYFRETAPGVYLARLPIVISHNATLEIDKRTQELHLSQTAGSFLVNDGMLFVQNTKVTGWNETTDGPSTFKAPKEFRPFLLSWGGTQTYIVNSKFASLGYGTSKSYGISISQYTPAMAKQMGRPQPTGWILGSEFSDMWYGFYCFETANFVVKSNTYHDNIIYGIDPHDRSHGLIIADNTVWGTQHKHGIIVSREVNDSWIINNRTFGNNLSGIVLDRKSVRNVVAYNQIYQNHSDGITLYESNNNMIWGNQVAGNKRHGIRIRNSQNVSLYNNLVLANHLVGIYGHVKDLSETGRNFKLDPYEPKLSLTVVGGQLIGNGTGPISVDTPQSLTMYNVDMLAPPKPTGIAFRGILGDQEYAILDKLMRQKQAVLIDPVASPAELHN